MNTIVKAAKTSTRFEKLNGDLKRRYFMRNIKMINNIMSSTPGYCGSFGTGYPFYVLNDRLEGTLPVIEEQIRYNDELLATASKYSIWECENCLKTRSFKMPDLKMICKPCPQVNNDIKPRKVLNRLPDVDMWMICQDDKIEEAKKVLVYLFNNYGMYTSDVDPVATINDFDEIVTQLEEEKMPSKMLPLDIHIIGYSEFASLLDEVPFAILNAINNSVTPYLPIHPQSLRKKWQYDDTAYNFILDFLLSITPFNWEKKLDTKLNLSRSVIINMFSEDDLKAILAKVSPPSVERRMKVLILQKNYERRINSWKR